MKVETRKEIVSKEIEVNTFIADDGMRFETALTCVNYERALADEELKGRLNKVETCEAASMFTPLDGGEYSKGYNYIWYRPKTADDIEALSEHYSLNGYISDKEIGDWVCIHGYNLGSQYHESHCQNLKYTLQYIPRMLDAFGYDITITKRDEQ